MGTMAETPSSSSSPSATEAASPPATLSLYGIARRHCREEILASPIRWTSRQLELLQCSFSEPLPEPVTAAATSVTEADYSDERTGVPHLYQFFNYYYKAVCREQGIRLLLTADGCPLVAFDSIKLYLNGAAVKSLYCVSLYLRRASSESAEPRRPIAAFIDRGHIESLRRESLGCLLCKHYYYNPPLSRLYSKKWKKFNPPDPRYDPYIVALLISLAQQKRRYLQEINSNEEALMGMIPSHALSTFYSKGKCKEKSEEAFLGWMYLYTARIPSSLLDMLDHPHVPPAAPPAFSVQVTTISYRPLATLRARLLALLLPETPTAPAQLAGQKRKFDGQGVQQPSSRGVPPFR